MYLQTMYYIIKICENNIAIIVNKGGLTGVYIVNFKNYKELNENFNLGLNLVNSNLVNGNHKQDSKEIKRKFNEKISEYNLTIQTLVEF